MQIMTKVIDHIGILISLIAKEMNIGLRNLGVWENENKTATYEVRPRETTFAGVFRRL